MNEPALAEAAVPVLSLHAAILPFRRRHCGKTADVQRAQLAAVAQVVLEGAPLPAERHELVDYARRQAAPDEVLAALGGIPDRSYERLDDVGEAIAPIQPAFASPAPQPRPESGEPPGGDAYFRPAAQPGAVRRKPDDSAVAGVLAARAAARPCNAGRAPSESPP